MAEKEQGTLTKQKRTAFVMSPHHLFCNSSITSEAKSLWVVLESKPEGWKFFWSEILKHFKEGRDQMIRAMGELEKLGYIQKKRAKKGNLYSGMDIQVFYDPLLPFDPHQQNQGSARDPEIQGTEIQASENQAPEFQKPEIQGTYKNLSKPNLPKQKIPNQKQGKGSGIFLEKKVWSVEEVGNSLSIETMQRIAAANVDLINFLEEFYVPWINKNGAPDNFDLALPARIEKFYKKKLPPRMKLEGSSKIGSFDPFEEEKSIREKIKFLMHGKEHYQLICSAPIEKSFDEWKLLFSKENLMLISEHEELLAQINVKIEVKP